MGKSCIEIFAERLKQLRKQKGVSQETLGKELIVSKAAISYYEKGERAPDIDTLNIIANYFGVSADYLLGRTDEKTADTDLQGVLNYTGLSEQSVNIITSGDNATVINQLLETDSFPDFLKNLASCYNELNKEQMGDDFSRQANIELMVWKVSQIFNDCVSEFFLNHAAKNLGVSP